MKTKCPECPAGDMRAMLENGVCPVCGTRVGGERMRMITFEIKRSRSKTSPWYWVIRASNGQCYAHSETYTLKSSARASVNNIIRAISLSQVRIEEV